jgi:hypothetical protein
MGTPISSELPSSAVPGERRSRKHMQVTKIVCVTLILGAWRQAMPTSITIQLEPNRILIAADTRARLNRSGSSSTDDLGCKILPFTNFAFTETGNIDYIPNGLADASLAWNAQSDAKAVADAHGEGDLVAIARDWAARNPGDRRNDHGWEKAMRS